MANNSGELIVNEITRCHGVKTMRKAIDFWRRMCRENPLLKQWLGRDYSDYSRNDAEQSIKVTLDMLSDTTRYEVMFDKMLRTIPMQPLQHAREQGACGMAFLHYAAQFGSTQSLEAILALYPESERLQALIVQDIEERTGLHYAAISGNVESIKLILALSRARTLAGHECA